MLSTLLWNHFLRVFIFSLILYCDSSFYCFSEWPKSLPWHLTSGFFVQSMFYSAIQWEIDVSQIAHIAPSIHISSSSTRNSQGNGYVCFCGLLLGGSMSIVAINVRGWYIASVSLQASTLILYFGLKSDNRSKIIWNVILTNTCLKKINHLLSREKKEK